MSTSPTSLSTSISASDSLGLELIEVFKIVLNEARLSKTQARRLAGNPDFITRLLRLIEEESLDLIIQETAFLKQEEVIIFGERATPLDPSKYFSYAKVTVCDNFLDWILPVLRPVPSTPKRIYGVGRLKQKATHQEVRNDLPNRHLGNWDDLASFIQMYPHGKPGYYRLYIKGIGGEVFALNMQWLSEYNLWVLRCSRLNHGSSYIEGLSVLCPKHEAL